MPIESENTKLGLCKVDAAVSTNEDQERQAAERRLVRKLDARLVLTVFFLYVMNFIDLVAVTAARIQGLQSDLGLSDVQYDTVVAIVYASLFPAQILSNMVISCVSRPGVYIGACVILWGLASALTGVTHNFVGIVVCRIFVGLMEAAFAPGAVYLLSSWYTRKEMALRTALFLSGFLISNAFGSLWAAGIFASMNGVRGIAAWRWLFYIEGAVTVFIGILALWLLPDYPTNTRWLTPAERHLAQIRLIKDAGEADQDSKHAPFFEGLKLALCDPIVLLFMVLVCTLTLGLSFMNFFPTLTATFGYSTTDTLLMAAPPWVLTTILTIINAWHADITGERFFHMTVWACISIVGYIISLSTMNTAVRYFSMFLLTTSISGPALVAVWLINSVPRPPAKRSAAIGLVNAFASLGSLTGSYIWKAKWGPGYHPSMIIGLCALVFSCALCCVIRTMLVQRNRRLEHEQLDALHGPERERIEEAARLEGITFDEALKRRMEFRYLY